MVAAIVREAVVASTVQAVGAETDTDLSAMVEVVMRKRMVAELAFTGALQALVTLETVVREPKMTDATIVVTVQRGTALKPAKPWWCASIIQIAAMEVRASSCTTIELLCIVIHYLLYNL